MLSEDDMEMIAALVDGYAGELVRAHEESRREIEGIKRTVEELRKRVDTKPAVNEPEHRISASGGAPPPRPEFSDPDLESPGLIDNPSAMAVAHLIAVAARCSVQHRQLMVELNKRIQPLFAPYINPNEPPEDN